MKLQFKTRAFTPAVGAGGEAKIASNSNAVARIVNKVNAACGRDSTLGYAGIASLEYRGANQD